ncbi:uncharacterized protein LOC111830604 [Capsella rubella]|uniref:uncharacterized protein LOC111830604 n=1 Tax=Capsella rubella TaxID=81985 RepID=UPI000CD5610F|nr:uncharacterized protein LOC111830604 [Capsella rubella]
MEDYLEEEASQYESSLNGFEQDEPSTLGPMKRLVMRKRGHKKTTLIQTMDMNVVKDNEEESCCEETDSQLSQEKEDLHHKKEERPWCEIPYSDHEENYRGKTKSQFSLEEYESSFGDNSELDEEFDEKHEAVSEAGRDGLEGQLIKEDEEGVVGLLQSQGESFLVVVVVQITFLRLRLSATVESRRGEKNDPGTRFIMVKNHPVGGVSRLNPSKYDLKIQVKVLCLWEENCLKLGPSLKMVLVGIQGEKVHCSFCGILYDRFISKYVVDIIGEVIHVGKFDTWDHLENDNEQKNNVQAESKSSSVYIRHLFKFICRDELSDKRCTSNDDSIHSDDIDDEEDAMDEDYEQAEKADDEEDEGFYEIMDTKDDEYESDGYGDSSNSEEEDHENDETETETEGNDDSDSDEKNLGYDDTQEETDDEEEYNASESNEYDDQEEEDIGCELTGSSAVNFFKAYKALQNQCLIGVIRWGVVDVFQGIQGGLPA